MRWWYHLPGCIRLSGKGTPVSQVSLVHVGPSCRRTRQVCPWLCSMARRVTSEEAFPVQALFYSCFIWTTKWRNCFNLIRKMTKDLSKSIRHYFPLQLLATAVISLLQFAPVKGFGAFQVTPEGNFSSSHGEVRQHQLAAWPGGLLKPCPICILPETHIQIHSDPEILGSTIKLAYCQRSRFLVCLQIRDWVCQFNQFSEIESCNTNSQLLPSSPLFIFPAPALDSRWFTDCKTKAHRLQWAHSFFITSTNSTDLDNLSIKKEGNKLVKSYQ